MLCCAFPFAVHSHTITNQHLMLKDFEKNLQPVEFGCVGSSSCVSITAARHLYLFYLSRWKADWQRPHPPDLLVIQGVHCDLWAQAVRSSYCALCHAARAQRLQRPQRLQRAYAPATMSRQLRRWRTPCIHASHIQSIQICTHLRCRV